MKAESVAVHSVRNSLAQDAFDLLVEDAKRDETMGLFRQPGGRVHESGRGKKCSARAVTPSPLLINGVLAASPVS